MTLVLVPVRYPLTEQSRATLRTAVELAGEHDGDLTVLHVNLYQSDRRVRRKQLQRAVERELGRLPRARYVVSPGLLIEEAILREAAAESADFVVIGNKRAGYLQRMGRRLLGTPDVERFLRERLDCRIVAADTT